MHSANVSIGFGPGIRLNYCLTRTPANLSPSPSSRNETSMLHAPFGSTGHQSSRILFGAAALGAMSQGRADATLAEAWPPESTT